MAKYEKTARDAGKTIESLMHLIPDEHLTDAAVLIGQIYNLGIRTAPRPTQSTVRYRAVKIAMEGLPVTITMKKVTDEETGNSFNALDIQPNSAATTTR